MHVTCGKYVLALHCALDLALGNCSMSKKKIYPGQSSLTSFFSTSKRIELEGIANG